MAAMTPAVAELDAAGIGHRVLEYQHDPAASSFGLEVADALDLAAEQVFKTLLVELPDDTFAVGIVPAVSRLDLKALARAAGAKRATMARVSDAERITGYVAGGISPFGQKRRLRTFVDELIEVFEEIYVSGGRRGLELAVAPADLITVLSATVAPIAVSG